MIYQKAVIISITANKIINQEGNRWEKEKCGFKVLNRWAIWSVIPMDLILGNNSFYSCIVYHIGH